MITLSIIGVVVVGLSATIGYFSSASRQIKKTIVNDYQYLIDHNGGSTTLTSDVSKYEDFYKVWNDFSVKNNSDHFISSLVQTPTGLELQMSSRV